MSGNLGIVIELIVGGLMAVTIGYCVMLERRLRAVRQDEAVMRKNHIGAVPGHRTRRARGRLPCDRRLATATAPSRIGSRRRNAMPSILKSRSAPAMMCSTGSPGSCRRRSIRLPSAVLPILRPPSLIMSCRDSRPCARPRGSARRWLRRRPSRRRRSLALS